MSFARNSARFSGPPLIGCGKELLRKLRYADKSRTRLCARSSGIVHLIGELGEAFDADERPRE
jgi:hypothetical protein